MKEDSSSFDQVAHFRPVHLFPSQFSAQDSPHDDTAPKRTLKNSVSPTLASLSQLAAASFELNAFFSSALTSSHPKLREVTNADLSSGSFESHLILKSTVSALRKRALSSSLSAAKRVRSQKRSRWTREKRELTIYKTPT